MKAKPHGEPDRKPKTALPLLQGVLPLDPRHTAADIVAGLTLAALAIPEVMGYTKIAGTPVITGLYTILIPIAVFAVFGSSRHLVVGADSATAAILAGGLTGMAALGSAQWTALSSLLALLTAGILAIARLARLGFLADYLSRTVLTGFLTGVGVQVSLGEIPGLLGLSAQGRRVLVKLADALPRIGQANVYDVAVAAAVLILILGGRKLSRRVPGALIAVIAAILVSWLFHLGDHGVTVLGPVPSGLPSVGLPPAGWSWRVVQHLLPTAAAMAVVVLAQSAATSRAYAWRYNERFSEETDLVGLALANLGAGLSGAFVVNGSPTKTEMVDSAGGRSQLSQLTTAAVVLVVLLFLTRPLAFMPVAVLSAVVFLIGLELIDIRGMRRIFAERRSEFWVALITAVTVVAVGVEQAILLAMTLSLLDHVRRGYRPKNSVIVARDRGGVRPVPLDQAAEIDPGLLVYRFNHSMYYANAEQLSEQVMGLANAAKPPLDWFGIDMDAVPDVDFSAGETLKSLYGMLKSKSVRLVFVQTSDHVRHELERYGIAREVGDDGFFTTVGELRRTFAAQRKG